eukprot:scaffold66655_cov68-Attheya_sp.AAC.1
MGLLVRPSVPPEVTPPPPDPPRMPAMHQINFEWPYTPMVSNHPKKKKYGKHTKAQLPHFDKHTTTTLISLTMPW